MNVKHSPYLSERRQMKVIRRSWDLRIIDTMIARSLAEAASIIPSDARLVSYSASEDAPYLLTLTFELEEEE